MDEKKSRYTQAQNRATQKYQRENLEQVNFRIKKGGKKYYQDAATAAGLSMAQFFLTAADEKIARDGLEQQDSQDDGKGKMYEKSRNC